MLRYQKNDQRALYDTICSQVHNQDVVIGANNTNHYENETLKKYELSFKEWMMFADTKTYLLDDILTKVDRSAMAVSLETRVPFLDHHIFEFAWSLPLEYKIKDNIGKMVLRDVLYKYVPQKLIDRPKMGFGVPLGKWLRHDLKDWAESLLDPVKMNSEGYLNARVIKKYWDEHQSGKRNWEYVIWNILMFQNFMAHSIRGSEIRFSAGEVHDKNITHYCGS